MAKKEKGALVKKEETKAVSPFAEMEQYVEDFFRNPFAMMTHPMMQSFWPKLTEMGGPSVDIFEEGDEVVVKAEVPGVDKGDIDVSITDNSLTISGEKKQEKKVDKKDYHRLERSYGSFSRSFRLPENVNGSKAKANFKDGILEVRLPKTKETKKKKIAIG